MVCFKEDAKEDQNSWERILIKVSGTSSYLREVPNNVSSNKDKDKIRTSRKVTQFRISTLNFY